MFKLIFLTFLLAELCAAVRMNSVTMVAKSEKKEAKSFDWPPFQFAKENFIELRAKMGRDSFLQGTISAGVLLDSFNGAAFLLAPGLARAAAGGLPPIPSSISHLLGVTFLSAGVGKATALTDGDINYQKKLCRNNLLPLGVLATTLIGIPFAPTTSNPLIAIKGIGAPLAATGALAWANHKASKYEPPKRK